MDDLTRAAFLKKRVWSGQVKLVTDANAVELTHLDKAYWSEEDYTKGDLLKSFHFCL